MGKKDPAPGKDKEKVAGIGASRKRKVGRIIGEEQLDNEGDVLKTRKESNDEARIAKASADVRRLLYQDADTTSIQENGTPANPSRSSEAADDKSRKEQKSRQNEPSQKIVKSAKKKPVKKIKLSFGDDDGE
ncbi:hypothetical protein NUW58_g9710 [Xylaria curta]|uniref:Uncharacterized protein n=1 Tax=Xylaria curta TaxID=42375 RepID=A0ACC1MUW5_9PEZI|nr:hypothetical protein NUW58_g9710 [Xylaria curta]